MPSLASWTALASMAISGCGLAAKKFWSSQHYARTESSEDSCFQPELDDYLSSLGRTPQKWMADTPALTFSRGAIGYDQRCKALHSFLAKLPLQNMIEDNANLDRMARQTLQDGKIVKVKEQKHDVVPLYPEWMFYTDSEPHEGSRTRELQYLRVLSQLSKDNRRSQTLAQSGVLHLLRTLHKSYKRSDRGVLLSEGVRVVANLAVQPDLREAIQESGWTSDLKELSGTQQPFSVQCQAQRALLNLSSSGADGVCFHDGVFLLHPLETDKNVSSDSQVDIVLVHGVRGGVCWTWRQQGAPATEAVPTAAERTNAVKRGHQKCSEKDEYLLSRSWPKAWLPHDIEGARLIAVDYDTSISRHSKQCQHLLDEQRRLAPRGHELLLKLKAADVGERPIIWVAHSMGGLLVKQMLVEAAKLPEHRGLVENSRVLVFYSTPHHGVSLPGKVRPVRWIRDFYLSVEMLELQEGSSHLEQLNDQFVQLAEEHSWRCASFCETQPTRLAPGIRTVLVPKKSANMQLGEFYTVATNHRDICKMTGRNDPRYRRLVELIHQSISR